jgi:hypothetical protein
MPEAFTTGRRVPAILAHLGDQPVRRGHAVEFVCSSNPPASWQPGVPGDRRQAARPGYTLGGHRGWPAAAPPGAALKMR